MTLFNFHFLHASELALANTSKKTVTVEEFRKEYCKGEDDLLDQVEERTGQIVDSSEQKEERDKKLTKIN